jgi:hypothetical protein
LGFFFFATFVASLGGPDPSQDEPGEGTFSIIMVIGMAVSLVVVLVGLLLAFRNRRDPRAPNDYVPPRQY